MSVEGGDIECEQSLLDYSNRKYRCCGSCAHITVSDDIFVLYLEHLQTGARLVAFGLTLNACVSLVATLNYIKSGELALSIAQAITTVCYAVMAHCTNKGIVGEKPHFLLFSTIMLVRCECFEVSCLFMLLNFQMVFIVLELVFVFYAAATSPDEADNGEKKSLSVDFFSHFPGSLSATFWWALLLLLLHVWFITVLIRARAFISKMLILRDKQV